MNDIGKSFYELEHSDIPEIKDAVHKSKNLAELYVNKEISKDEFIELLTDICSMEKIDESMTSFENYREIVKAFKLLIQLKSVLSLF